MRAISLWQPWASLVAAGVKTVETRSWSPPASLIGERIAIHAAKKKSTPRVIDGLLAGRACEVLCRCRMVGYYDGTRAHAVLNTLPSGVVLCTAVLYGAMRVDRHAGDAVSGTMLTRAGARPFTHCPIDHWGDFSLGRWLWFLRGVELLSEPVAVRGRQRIFDVDLSLSPASAGEVEEGVCDG